MITNTAGQIAPHNRRGLSRTRTLRRHPANRVFNSKQPLHQHKNQGSYRKGDKQTRRYPGSLSLLHLETEYGTGPCTSAGEQSPKTTWLRSSQTSLQVTPKLPSCWWDSGVPPIDKTWASGSLTMLHLGLQLLELLLIQYLHSSEKSPESSELVVTVTIMVCL